VPLLAYLINPQWLGRPWRLLVYSTPVALLIVPVCGLFNHNVLNATPVGIIRSLEIFDITGVAFYSGDLSVFGRGNSFTRQDVESCYTPIQWDTLSPWGKCRFFWNRLAVSQDVREVEKLAPMDALEARPNPDLRNHWGASIIAHPLAYARHRLAHFSSEIFLLVQPDHGDVAALGARTGEDVPVAQTRAMLREPLYLMLYDVLKTPAFWLAMGACLLVMLTPADSAGRSVRLEAALALVISSLLYTCAYLIVGVGTDLRYQFWSMVATFTALVISVSELRGPFVLSAIIPSRRIKHFTGGEKNR
jgi:hypothetical protein